MDDVNAGTGTADVDVAPVVFASVDKGVMSEVADRGVNTRK